MTGHNVNHVHCRRYCLDMAEIELFNPICLEIPDFSCVLVNTRPTNLSDIENALIEITKGERIRHDEEYQFRFRHEADLKCVRSLPSLYCCLGNCRGFIGRLRDTRPGARDTPTTTDVRSTSTASTAATPTTTSTSAVLNGIKQ